MKKKIFMLLTLLLLSTVSCEAVNFTMASNNDGTLRAVATDNHAVVVEKVMHRDKSEEYFWTFAEPIYDTQNITPDVYGDTLTIIVDESKKFICPQELYPEFMNSQHPIPTPDFANKVTYSIPVEAINAIKNYKKSVGISYSFNNEIKSHKNIDMKKKIIEISAITYDSLIKP